MKISDPVEHVALAIERSMFAPHELPLDDELHGKYRVTAKAAIEAYLETLRAPTQDMVEAPTHLIDIRGLFKGKGRSWRG